MEALSAPSAASSLKPAAALLAAPRPTQLLHPPPHPASLPVLSTADVKPKSTRPAKLLLRPTSPLRRLYLPPRCAAASTGYAAALLDAACCNGVLDTVERDARRLLRGLRAIPALGERAKGKVVRRVSEGGGFYRNLVVLVRMLVAKGKTLLVEEVMEEIGRICDEMRGARVVVNGDADEKEDGVGTAAVDRRRGVES